MLYGPQVHSALFFPASEPFAPLSLSFFRHSHPLHLVFCKVQTTSSSRLKLEVSISQELPKIGELLKSMESKAPPCHPTYDLKAVIKLALAEDSADKGDVTSMATIPAQMQVEAQFLAKEDGIIAGIALAEMIFHEVDPSLKVEWCQKDGDHVHKGLRLGKVYGRAHSIVVAERVVLNFMQRMSGIATLTKLVYDKIAKSFICLQAMADAASPAVILETRKTAPGLRLVDKWAVLIGGGKNHRLGLFDMVLIKDNHVSIAGGITKALKSTDHYLLQNNLQMEVEVETRTLEEVKEVLEYASQNKTSLTRIMLDNMVIPQSNGDIDVSMLKEAVRMIDGRFETELPVTCKVDYVLSLNVSKAVTFDLSSIVSASGNVTLDTVHQIGQTGVTYISSGALTHSVRALDISLKIDTELALEVGRRTNRA
uniref:nicotinate-nucleotide diphosphorylase (carboxylating) n=1 Tax=Chenopodium quinoa TaxID=63459 RepID=A0A803MNV4_CHEQI